MGAGVPEVIERGVLSSRDHGLLGEKDARIEDSKSDGYLLEQNQVCMRQQIPPWLSPGLPMSGFAKSLLGLFHTHSKPQVPGGSSPLWMGCCFLMAPRADKENSGIARSLGSSSKTSGRSISCGRTCILENVQGLYSSGSDADLVSMSFPHRDGDPAPICPNQTSLIQLGSASASEQKSLPVFSAGLYRLHLLQAFGSLTKDVGTGYVAQGFNVHVVVGREGRGWLGPQGYGKA